MSEELDQILAYHQATKHSFEAMAPGPRGMDWANEPKPFCRYRGAPLILLEKKEPEDGPLYDPSLKEGGVLPAPLNFESVSQLFFDGLAVSAWRRAGQKPWALRVNPSSGNLHPTEGYLVAGPVPGLADYPTISHYAPRVHGLEVRASFSLDAWEDLTADLPEGSVLVGLASVPWRESWKYGERAFRYIHLNAGHALGAMSVASACLGWKATLLDDLGTGELETLLGLTDPRGAEHEVPDFLLAIHPQDEICKVRSLPAETMEGFAELSWQGQPERLSPDHVDWPLAAGAVEATAKPRTEEAYRPSICEVEPPKLEHPPISLRKVVRQRRSAIVMDGTAAMSRDVFYRILGRTLPGGGRYPFNAIHWKPKVHLAMFVHRVLGLERGLYLQVRDLEQTDSLRSEMRVDFEWERPEGSPPGFYRLISGGLRKLVRMLSCNQKIASDGCFSLGMIARFRESLEQFGPWFYNRLHWECGMIGQLLYLEAEAAGMNGCGIGCYFDDVVHSALGLEGVMYQSIYHFTVGRKVPLRNIETLPAYPAPDEDRMARRTRRPKKPVQRPRVGQDLPSWPEVVSTSRKVFLI